jgi:Matrixin
MNGCGLWVRRATTTSLLVLRWLGPLAFGGTPAQAFILNNTKWLERPVYFYGATNVAGCCLSDAAAERAILSGRNQWPTLRNLASASGKSQATLSVSWAKLGRVTASITVYDKVLGRASTEASPDRCQRCAESAFLELTSASVRFNNYAAIQWFDDQDECLLDDLGGFDLRAVAAHEFGHALGIAHSDVRAATMAASLGRCSFRSYPLKTDDRLAHRAIYERPCEEPESCGWIRVKFASWSCRVDLCGREIPTLCPGPEWARFPALRPYCEAGKLQALVDFDGPTGLAFWRHRYTQCNTGVECCYGSTQCSHESKLNEGLVEVERGKTYCFDVRHVHKANRAYCSGCDGTGSEGRRCHTETRVLRPCTEREITQDTCRPYQKTSLFIAGTTSGDGASCVDGEFPGLGHQPD